MFVDNNRLTASGQRLVTQIDRHLAAKRPMTDEMRHYAAAVYRARLMRPMEWLSTYPDKAEAIWAFFNQEGDEEDDLPPPPFCGQPMIRLD